MKSYLELSRPSHTRYHGNLSPTRKKGRLVNIVVCVKQVVDTEAEKRLDPDSWRLDRSVDSILNPYDEYAVEEALLLKEAHEGEVTVLCTVSYTHLRAHETDSYLVCRLLL